MFGADTVTRGLSLAKVLTGINKTLSVANQVIPIYQQALVFKSSSHTHTHTHTE